MSTHDLRGPGEPTTLYYPAGTVVVVAGIPGAGKTTLLRRLFGLTGQETGPVALPGGAWLLDSEQARNRWRGRLGDRVPYAAYRPLVHLTHYLAVYRAVRAGRGVVLHDCGTRRALLRLLTGDRAHLVALDVSAADARAGQYARGRRVRGRSFRRHDRAWRFPSDGGLPPVAEGYRSLVVLDRVAADRIAAIVLGGPINSPTAAIVL
ncbi:AAA family ATPase [Longispora sp. NPDC051575]|uniref:AAA family ATPase n=1 Tax=Longispora sp. NPDC051575 TaxID=3154943 RepID=UPI00344A74E3